jgi:hypothetical protein
MPVPKHILLTVALVLKYGFARARFMENPMLFRLLPAIISRKAQQVDLVPVAEDLEEVAVAVSNAKENSE